MLPRVNSFRINEREGKLEIGSGMDGGGFEERGDEGEGQSDDVEVTAFDAGNPAGGAALDGVGAGFVHGFAGGDVGGNLLFGEGEKTDGGVIGGFFSGVVG